MATQAGELLERFPAVRAALKRLWYAKKYALRRSEGIHELKATFQRVYGRPLEIEHPSRFTEKLFRRMVRWHETGCDRFTALADKLQVRSYVANRVGERYLADIYWDGADPGDIPFDALPRRYALKTNHGSAHVILTAEDSVDRAEAISRLRGWLSTNHYWKEREYQYLDIVPRVYAEEFLDDGVEAGPLDYRFWCFGGVPRVVQVDNHLHDINPFYDLDWRLLDLSYRAKIRPIEIPRPANLEEMVSVASALANDFDFVRVDLYNIHGRIVFGEMTFTPVAGFLKFKPDHWDIELGRLWPEPGSDGRAAGVVSPRTG